MVVSGCYNGGWNGIFGAQGEGCGLQSGQSLSGCAD